MEGCYFPEMLNRLTTYVGLGRKDIFYCTCPVVQGRLQLNDVSIRVKAP